MGPAPTQALDLTSARTSNRGKPSPGLQPLPRNSPVTIRTTHVGMSFSSARLCSIYNPKSIIPDTNFLGVHVPFSLDTQSFTTEHTIHRNAPSRPSRHHITFPFSPNRSAGWAGKFFTDNDKAEHTAAVLTAVASSFTQIQNTRSTLRVCPPRFTSRKQ